MNPCALCLHFHRQNELGGLCRRHAPRATLITRFRPEFGGNVPAWPNETATIWAPVHDHDTCGDWTSKPTTSLAGEPDREG